MPTLLFQAGLRPATVFAIIGAINRAIYLATVCTLFVAVICALFCSSSLAAQGAPLDLATAVSQGLANSPLVREAEEKLNQYRYEKHQLRSELLPNVSLMASRTYRKDSVADMTVGMVPFGGESYNVYNVGLRAEQTLLAYGLFSGVGRAELMREIGVESLTITRRNLTRDVISVFYKTVMNENLVRLLEEQEKGVRETLVVAQRRLGVGGRKIDVLQVRTRLALLKPKIEQARNELAASTARLASLIGLSRASELRIKGQLPSLTIGQVEKRLNLKQFDIPDLKLIELQRAQLGKEKSVALGRHLPHLKLVGDASFMNFTQAELFDESSRSWAVQLVLTVPFFSGLSSVSERRAFMAREAQLYAQEANMTNLIQLEQIRSRKELESAEASLNFAQEGAELAQASLLEARREYRVGLLDFLQFFQVESANFEAQTSLLQLRFDAIQAYTNYFVSSGQSLTTLVEPLNEQGRNER